MASFILWVIGCLVAGSSGVVGYLGLGLCGLPTSGPGYVGAALVAIAAAHLCKVMKGA